MPALVSPPVSPPASPVPTVRDLQSTTQARYPRWPGWYDSMAPYFIWNVPGCREEYPGTNCVERAILRGALRLAQKEFASPSRESSSCISSGMLGMLPSSAAMLAVIQSRECPCNCHNTLINNNKTIHNLTSNNCARGSAQNRCAHGALRFIPLPRAAA